MKASKTKPPIRRLGDLVSPAGWLFTFLAMMPPVLLLMRPTWTEFLVMTAIDLVAVVSNRPFERWLFVRLYPATRHYFNGWSDAAFEKLDPQGKVQVIESLFALPERRAKFVYWYTALKAIPAACVIIFFWETPRTYLEQALLLGAICMFNWSFFYGEVFLATHGFATHCLERLHQGFDVRELLRAAKIPYSRGDFEKGERLALGFVTAFTIVLQIAAIRSLGPDAPQMQIMGTTAAIAFLGFLLFGRVWFVGRRFFSGALETLYQHLKDSDEAIRSRGLALHSAGVLAKFEQSFNDLTFRLHAKERELIALVFSETDGARFRMVGELTGLVTHDLSAPIHVAEFCVTRLLEDPNGLKPEKRIEYLERLRRAVSQCSSLVTSLRARLRNPDGGEGSVEFAQAHEHVLDLLRVAYGKGLAGVRIELDPLVKNVLLRIPSVDLIHILSNLYGNSLHSMREAGPSPALEITKVSESLHDVGIEIRDSGLGLSREDFDRFTHGDFTQGKPLPRKGLGLRLTRRLIEYHGGKLEWVEIDEPGTALCLSLPKALPINADGGKIEQESAACLDT